MITVQREIDGKTAYWRVFGTPRANKIKGHSDWTYERTFAQEFSTHGMAGGIVQTLVKSGIQAEVRD